MKRKTAVSIFAAAFAAIACAAFAACGDKDKGGGDKPAGVTYTVSYDGNGGSGAPENMTVNADTEITVADGITKIGYTISGWTTGGVTYNAGDKYKVTADTTFTALWAANTYTVKFDGNGGEGVMTDATFTYDEQKALPPSMFLKSGVSFAGWAVTSGGQIMYADEQTVKNLTAESGGIVTLYAVWLAAEKPVFSQAEYEYDKAGGEVLELPLDLKGSDLVYVEFDGDLLTNGQFDYNRETHCLEISEDIILSKPLGKRITVTAITDSEATGDTVCGVTLTNSIATVFDETTVKQYKYGYGEDDVRFSLTGNVTVSGLTCNGIAVPTDMYSYTDETLSVSGEWLVKFSGDTEFTVSLSNNDRYDFTVYNNIVFCTDYDVTTEHSDVKSNVGMNPLYQYSDNATVVDAPENSGMDGNVLKITPNTRQVPSDCNRYITITTPESTSTWHKADFKQGKYYVVTFDYYTENTTVGTFVYGASYDAEKTPLLLGADNDGKVHNYSGVYSYDRIKGIGDGGLSIYAFFENGGGEVYVDNFRVVELDSLVTVGTPSEYGIVGNKNYTLDIDAGGMAYKLYLGEQVLDYTVDAGGKTVIDADDMKLFALGSNTVRIVTAFFEQTITVSVINDQVAELTETSKTFSYYGNGVSFAGNFDEGVTVTSLKQCEKTDNGGYDGEQMYFGNYEKDYKEYASVTAGKNGAGALVIDKELLKKFYGTTEFNVTLSNGATQKITVNASDILFTTDYDNVDVHDRNYTGVLAEQLAGADVQVKEREAGNNALYVYDTSASADPKLLSIKFFDHVWYYFKVRGYDENDLARITFTYRAAGVSDVTFCVLKPNENELNSERNFFGDGGNVSVGAWAEYRYALDCDGQEHTFDSNWFTSVPGIPLMQLRLPKFTAAENTYVMIDDIVITKTARPTLDLAEYTQGREQDYTVDLTGRKVLSVKMGETEYVQSVADGVATLDKAKLDALDPGTHKFTVATDAGWMPVWIPVKGSGVAQVTKTDHDYTFGSGDLDISGTFRGVTVTSASKKGSFVASLANGSNAYEFDQSPTALDVSNFVVASDKITVKKALLDTFYLTTAVTLGFSNGDNVTLNITTNVKYFSDFDNTYVMMRLRDDNGNGYNLHLSHDSAMMSVVETEGGNHALRYCTGDYTLGHVVDPAWATLVNTVMFFEADWGESNIYTHNVNGKPVMDASHNYTVTFDYEIVNTEGNAFTYSVLTGNKVVAIRPEDGKSSGSMSVTLIGGDTEANNVHIRCDRFPGVKGCYMLIDNFRIVELNKE